MSDESYDLAAAEKGFNEILQQMPSDERKRLNSEFVKAFLKNYKSIMREEVPPDKYYSRIESIFSLAKDGINIGLELGIREYSQHLGGSLGAYMAAVEKFIIPLDPKMVPALRSRILALNNELAVILRASNRHVKEKFIRWRLEAIASKHRDKLTPEKIELIVMMARQFA
ncbi:hypothetical protein JXB28_02600 [Candidatus Woesearchaeota archaeon]|nr:hypothetical protein [Candidatus Woesearchaeota archaeon]